VISENIHYSGTEVAKGRKNVIKDFLYLDLLVSV